MRATDLNLRSPKEFTPDYYHPKVACDGRLISTKANTYSFSRSLRFKDNDSSKLGPGSYDLNKFTFIKPSILQTPRIVGVPGKKDLGNSGYVMIGNSMVFHTKYGIRRSSVTHLATRLHSPMRKSKFARKRSVDHPKIEIKHKKKKKR